MIETFEIDSEAKMFPSEENVHKTDSTKVLVYIDHENKVVYLWRGDHAGVMKKLVGTRIAAMLSHKYPAYRIRPISEGAEPAAFRALLQT
ncbi:MAG: hypothetical protein HXY34_13795 [Candidatus Thorarchaeota archaeon]|nr:hypothetical protein [Candidatus Thorarchaeota archaeon]